LVSK
jgi:hypothetical protein